jgi:hypothetical protein
LSVGPVFGAFVKFGRTLFLLCAIALGSGGAAPGHGQELWHDTSLLSVNLGSVRSSVARSLGRGRYELDAGTPVDLSQWYTTKRQDLTVLFLRRVTPDLGLIWGLSTGELAPKYRIDPALHLGFAWRHQFSARGSVSVAFVVPFWGQLRERECTARYGSFGVHRVNCRLASGELPPEETLKYLVNMSGLEDARLTLRLSWQF